MIVARIGLSIAKRRLPNRGDFPYRAGVFYTATAELIVLYLVILRTV